MPDNQNQTDRITEEQVEKALKNIFSRWRKRFSKRLGVFSLIWAMVLIIILIVADLPKGNTFYIGLVTIAFFIFGGIYSLYKAK